MKGASFARDLGPEWHDDLDPSRFDSRQGDSQSLAQSKSSDHGIDAFPIHLLGWGPSNLTEFIHAQPYTVDHRSGGSRSCIHAIVASCTTGVIAAIATTATAAEITQCSDGLDCRRQDLDNRQDHGNQLEDRGRSQGKEDGLASVGLE